MPTLKNFVIVGGEPLINDELFKCLEYISETENAENIQLRITTNLTVMPQHFLKILKRFKGVHFLVSIDAVYEMHEYIRYPSKFKSIEKNLNSLLEWEHAEFWVEITTCVMSWNLFEFSKTLDFFSKYSQHPRMKGWVPWFNYVTSPNYACPEAIPKKLKFKKPQI
jgi:sulfatase maturation enzyme AslB (radical SAM superfamily)